MNRNKKQKVGISEIARYSPWLEQGGEFFHDLLSVGCETWVCSEGIRKVFHLPREIAALRFVLRDRETPESVPVSLVGMGWIVYGQIGISETAVPLSLWRFLSDFRRLGRWIPVEPVEPIYVSVEYL